MNATFEALLRACTTEAERDTLHTLATAAGLIRHCEPCSATVPGGTACPLCHTPPGLDEPAPAVLSVVPVLSLAGGVPVAVFDTDPDAEAAAAAVNARHGHDVVATASGIPHNPLVHDPDLLDHLAALATGEG